MKTNEKKRRADLETRLRKIKESMKSENLLFTLSVDKANKISIIKAENMLLPPEEFEEMMEDLNAFAEKEEKKIDSKKDLRYLG
ncbi:MAG: hypothetical protein HYS32_03165 [Candidatus Woesearchaeota archaeon]|nr:MAG: hypothetical protein HYS32_03165 [Candidatus Woesearchaeota archaeon]